MSSSKQLHHEAMNSLRKADEALAQRDMELYNSNLRDALELETNAATLLKDKFNAEPTRSVLYRSAASIAVSCGEYKRAEKLVVQALRGSPPQEIKNELLELFDEEIVEHTHNPVAREVFKRVFDVVFSILVLTLLLPLFILIPLFIKFDSRGPVFYWQIRIGRNNRPFRCFKFRTMRLGGADENYNKGDNRVTRLGGFMRRHALDELPQFINVLKGEMSIVGPKPVVAEHHREFAYIKGAFNSRSSAMPGITGLAESINLKNEPRPYIQYSEKWSPLVDIKIIIIAFLQAIRGQKNAYSISDDDFE
jgi:lipopolysaccharide/colanic/teichoic acid biosynthesis glycosyltransferase